MTSRGAGIPRCMDDETAGWSAELRFGPFDGATAGFTVRAADLPRAVIVTFVVEDEDGEPVWHSYALDRAHDSFRYLGEDTNAEEDPADVVLDAPVHGHGVVDAPDDGLTRRFYQLLFERYPEVRPLFAADIDPQARRLRTALRSVLEHVGEPEWLVTTLGALGAQHAQWGVTPQMYDAFGECMVEAMREIGGADWTEGLAAAWTETFAEVRDLMLAGAEAAARATEDDEP